MFLSRRHNHSMSESMGTPVDAPTIKFHRRRNLKRTEKQSWAHGALFLRASTDLTELRYTEVSWWAIRDAAESPVDGEVGAPKLPFNNVEAPS
jgi:hypothetical protein